MAVMCYQKGEGYTHPKYGIVCRAEAFEDIVFIYIDEPEWFLDPRDIPGVEYEEDEEEED